VDHCCMQHDLRLGRARQADKSVNFSAGSMTSAAINAKLASCFNAAQGNKDVDGWGKFYAGYGKAGMGGMAGWDPHGAGENAAAGAVSSAWASVSNSLGFGGAGAAGSAGGASGSW